MTLPRNFNYLHVFGIWDEVEWDGMIPLHPMFGSRTHGMGPSPRENILSRCGIHPSLPFERTGVSLFGPVMRRLLPWR